MEHFANQIGTLILVAIVVLSMFGDKKKRPKQQGGEQPAPKPFDPFGPSGPLGMPQSPTPATPKPARTAPARAKQPKSAPIMQGKTPNELIADLLHKPSKTAQNARQTSVPQPTAPTAAPTPKAADTPQNDALPVFDLRQAVIYSEILQPKFKEYEQ